ncbi:latrophilin-like protein 1 [Glandiceps talaboti]
MFGSSMCPQLWLNLLIILCNLSVTTESSVTDNSKNCSIPIGGNNDHLAHIRVFAQVRVKISCAKGYTINKGESNSAELTCETVGEWNLEIPHCDDINECLDPGLCDKDLKNEECVNTVGNYSCECKVGYYKDSLGECRPGEAPNDDATKEEDTCSINSEGSPRITCKDDNELDVTWNETVANCSTPWIPCPNIAYGSMKRKCNIDGTWQTPETTECKSLKVLELLKGMSVVNSTESANNNVDGVSDFLDNEDGDVLFGGDLVVTAEAVSEIIDANPLTFNAPDDVKVYYIKNVLEVFSRLLDEDKEEHWKQINEVKGAYLGVVPVAEDLERFGKSVHMSVIDNQETVSESTKNIKLKAEFVSSRHLVKRSAVNSDDQCAPNTTCVTLPSYLQDNNTTDSLVMITILYHNPADIIPPDFGSSKSKLRRPVKTITAAEKEERVNSEVLSVSLFLDGEEIVDLVEPHTSVSSPITMTFHAQQKGYDEKCSYMKYGDSTGVWSTDGCTTEVSSNIITCKCTHLTNFAVVMTLGTEPLPFFEQAEAAFIMIFNFLAAFLLMGSFILVCLSRLSTDRYFVIGNMIISLLLLPASVLMNLTEFWNIANCDVIQFVWYLAILSNFAWMLNHANVQLFKLKFYVLSNNMYKGIYFLFGWLFPLIVAVFFTFVMDGDVESDQRYDNDLNILKIPTCSFIQRIS